MRKRSKKAAAMCLAAALIFTGPTSLLMVDAGGETTVTETTKIDSLEKEEIVPQAKEASNSEQGYQEEQLQKEGQGSDNLEAEDQVTVESPAEENQQDEEAAVTPQESLEESQTEAESQLESQTEFSPEQSDSQESDSQESYSQESDSLESDSLESYSQEYDSQEFEPQAAAEGEEASKGTADSEIEADPQGDYGIMPMNLGTAAIYMVGKNDGKITNESEFVLGSKTSTQFTIYVYMNTAEKENFQYTIPQGFKAAMKNVDGFSLSEETAENGDMIYTYTASNSSAEGHYDCQVTVDYDTLMANALKEEARMEYTFLATIVSNDGLTVTDMDQFTISIPELASYSLKQVDTINNNLIWTPAQLAGTTINAGVQHSGNQADTVRPGVMTKRLQVEIQKEAGSTFQADWSLDTPLPLYVKTIATNRVTTGYPQVPRVELFVNGTWKTMENYTNAFQTLIYPDSAKYDVKTTSAFGLPSNMEDTVYVNEQILTLKDGLVSSLATDKGLGTEKPVYQWLSEATAIRVNYGGDVIWDPIYNGEDPRANLDTAALQDNAETYVAADVTTLTAGGVPASTMDPMVINLVNGSDTTMKVAIATIDKIQMDVSTTKVTDGQNGYLAAFGTAKNDNYAYFTNLEASYDFPWEYSPTGTITLCPLAANGIYKQERNLTGYDYRITISNTNGTYRVLDYPHKGYVDPNTGKALAASASPDPSSVTLELAENEWVSNITVTADKAWKQSFTSDVSLLTSATMNHPLFYANCSSKGTYENGEPHKDGDVVDVQCQITTDQNGTVKGETKKVTLIGPKDNILLWSEDDSALRYPIGAYGEGDKLEYLELHLKKYTDTATYEDPYIELTGDALGLLNKITYASRVGGTDAAPVYNYLNLRGYRLNDGTWVDVDESQAAAMLNEDKGYYDLSSKIPADSYLTGVRLAPNLLNETIVDTTTTPEDVDPSDGVTKHYLQETYYLYLYDKVWPSWLGYDETLKKTYSDITDLDSPLSFDLTFHCDYLDDTHLGMDHIKNDCDESDRRTATLIFGDLPDHIFGRDNDYDVATGPIEGEWAKYYVTELTNVAIDDGPASSSTINAWGEMQYATLKFSNDTANEKRMLALTKGVSLIGANWQGASYLTNEYPHAIIRYQTNKTGNDWVIIDNPDKTYNRNDRGVNYFTLAEDEYVTAVEVDYPVDFIYKAGYNAAGVETGDTRSLQLSDVGLLTKGRIPTVSPVEGDSHIFYNGEQLPYHAELTYTDIGGQEHVYGLDYETARLQPYPTMLVDNFVSSVDYNGDSVVYQGAVLTANLHHTYSFTNSTKDIDPDKVIHPTLCYELDRNFTISDTAVLAAQLGVNPNQITLAPKNDDSGDSILKITYGPQGPRTRDLNFDLTIPLTAKPNATPTNVVPIKNAWLTLDYDTTLSVDQEGEYVAINGDSKQIELSPGTVLDDTGWETGQRQALVTKLTPAININRYQAASMQFYGTDGTGGGIGMQVTGRDSTDENIFGIGETLYAPSDPSTNWVIYVGIPRTGQQVPYGANYTADPSEYSLIPAKELTIDSITGANYDVEYFIPAGQKLVPSMAGLTLTEADTTETIVARDQAADLADGEWKTWASMTEQERKQTSYVRIIADNIPGEAELSSTLLLQLQTESAKTKVGEMYAYTSLIYNYVKQDGAMAFPESEVGNMMTNGKGSNYVKYILTDFSITGQLWQEHNFNNAFITADGDVLTREGMRVTLVNSDGETLEYKDGSPVEVIIDNNGFYTAPVPSKGLYFLTMTATDKDWLPVSYHGGNIQNGMQFHPGQDWKGDQAENTVSTAQVEITNNDVQYINGGIEQWGTLTVDKRVAGDLSDVSKNFSFRIRPDGATIVRNYSGVITENMGTGEETSSDVTLGGGSDNVVAFGHNDKIEIRLPVGLGYTITEDNTGYTTTIETLENGTRPEELTTNPYGGNVVRNQIVAVTYDTDEDQGDGGNVDHYLNERFSPTLTDVKMDGKPFGALLLFAGLSLGGYGLSLRIRRRRRYPIHKKAYSNRRR